MLKRNVTVRLPRPLAEALKYSFPDRDLPGAILCVLDLWYGIEEEKEVEPDDQSYRSEIEELLPNVIVDDPDGIVEL